MDKRNIMLTAVIILGIMLAGITGYLVWSTVHDRYVKAEDIGAFKDSAPDMGVPGGSGHGGLAEGRPEDGDSLHGNRGGNEPWDSSGPWNPASDGQPADAGDGQGPGTAGDSLENGLGTAGSGQDMGDEGAGADGTDDSTIHFVFAGDILLSDHVLGAYNKAGDISGVVDGTFRSVIDSSDVFMANEEFPFSSRGTAAADKQFTFRLPPEKVSIFQELGIDIVTLANNHALDFGTDALLDTCHTLDQAGIYRVGAGANLDEAKRPVIMEIKGKKIGFLGASRVIPVGSWNAT
ncbi:MAG: CapA family protein, partial [Enterocloster aldenensis]